MTVKRSDDTLTIRKGWDKTDKAGKTSAKTGYIPSGWRASASSVFHFFYSLLKDVAVAVDIEDVENIMVVPLWGIKVINEGLS